MDNRNKIEGLNKLNVDQLNNNSCDMEGIRRIAIGVVLSSLMGIENGSGGRAMKNKESALTTLNTLKWMHTPGFEQWCDLVGVNHETVIRFGKRIYNGDLENNKETHDKLHEFLVAIGD